MTDIWKDVSKGLTAGFVATLVLSAIMIAKSAAGLAPQLNAIHMLAGILGSDLAGGWIAHFVIGTIFWGVLYALLDPSLPGPHWLRGAIFSIGPWLLMMIAIMPVAGAGFFGMHIGPEAPVATLILHIVYGVVLGATYGALAGHGSAQRFSESHRS
jgi:hypothetical protein